MRDRLTVWRGTALAAGAVALALGAGGCGGGSSNSGASSQSGGGSGGSHRGGTMILLSNASWGTLDPAKNYTVLGFETAQYVSDGLVGFKRAGGRASTIIVPDLATSVPAPTDGGKTYVFHIRPGIRYSNGGTVKPSDFLTTFTRQFTVPGPANGFYQGIVGGAQCANKPATCDLSKGVIPDDATGTLTIHLTSPTPSSWTSWRCRSR